MVRRSLHHLSPFIGLLLILATYVLLASLLAPAH
jgi:hypothetical protein